MISSTKDYDIACLSEASCVDFSGIDFSDGNVEIRLKDMGYKGHFSALAAEEFVSKWEIAAHQPETETGFSATLFKEKSTGDYYYATRGTSQLWVDLVKTDIMDIASDGLAVNQILDMYNDWKRINTRKGAVYKAARFTLMEDESNQFSEMLNSSEFTATQIDEFTQSLLARDNVVIDTDSDSCSIYMIDPDVDSDRLFTDPKDQRKYGAGIIIGHNQGGNAATSFSRLLGSEAVGIWTTVSRVDGDCRERFAEVLDE